MTISIDQARVERLLSPDFHLRSGSGSGANGVADVCILQAVHWLAGGDGASDAPECADPVVRGFCIRLNDASRFAEWRDELKPFAVRIAGTNVSVAATEQRRWMCADWAIRTIAPMVFDYWAEAVPARRDEATERATRLRAVAPVTDKTSALAAREVALAARKAAAAAAADAAAAAAYAADAADAAAAAAADAAAAAAYAADAAAAAAYAADAAAARAKSKAFARALWIASLAQLDRLIAVTETGAAA